MHWLFLRIAALLLVTACGDCLALTIRYVSPSGAGTHSGINTANAMTLVEARTWIRNTHPQNTDEVHIRLVAGTYYIDEPFILDGASGDSGTAAHPITWIAHGPFNGVFHDVLIHGGKRVTSWTNMGTGAGYAGRKWVGITAPPGPAPVFRDLYYQNKRLTRARFPNKDACGRDVFLDITAANWEIDIKTRYYRVNTIIPGVVPLPPQVEAVGRISFSMPRQIVNGAQHGASLTHLYFSPGAPFGWVPPCATPLPYTSTQNPYPCPPDWRSFQVRAKGALNDPFSPPINDASFPGHKLYLENSPGFVDGLYEWHHNEANGQLTVLLPNVAGEDPRLADHEIVFPVAEQLWVCNDVEYVNLVHLNFAFDNFPLPSGGYVPLQAGHVSPSQFFAPRGAVQFTNARNCRVAACRIAHTGGSGLVMTGPTCPGGTCLDQHFEIEGNKIFDVGGSAIYVNGEVGSLQDPRYRDLVRSNMVFDFGQTFQDTVGVFVPIEKEMVLSFNEIARGGYSGVNVGVWLVPEPAGSDNLIYGNSIHDVMRIAEDGGAIYLQGGGGGTIQNNHVYNLARLAGMTYGGGYGLDWDEGAQGSWTVVANVLHVPYVLDPRFPAGWGETAISNPMSFHYGGGCTYCVNAFSPAQFTFGYNYSSVVPIHGFTPAVSPWQPVPNVLTMWSGQPCVPVAAAQQIMQLAGPGCAAHYPYSSFNRQIDPPGTVVCEPLPSSSLPPLCIVNPPCQ